MSIQLKKSFVGVEFSKDNKPITIPISETSIVSLYDGSKSKYPSKNHTFVLQLEADDYNVLYDTEKACLDKLVEENVDIKGFKITNYMIMDHYKSDLVASTSTIKVKCNSAKTGLFQISNGGEEEKKLNWQGAGLHEMMVPGAEFKATITPSLFWVMEKEISPMMGISWYLTNATYKL